MKMTQILTNLATESTFSPNCYNPFVPFVSFSTCYVWVPGLAPTNSLPLQWGPNTLDTALKSGTEPIRCGALLLFEIGEVQVPFI